MISKKLLKSSGNNHERWLVSYSDFMTLLFAFFVVMYAISSVNEGKYRVLSEALNETFTSAELSPEPIQIGKPAKASSPHVIVLDQLSDGIDSEEGDTQLQVVAESIETGLEGIVSEEELSVRSNEQWLELDLQASVLFSSAEVQISDSGKTVIQELSDRLKSVNYPITVEGYSDSSAVAGQFASNWELSAARAASVVRYLISLGIDSTRLAVAAYGDNHPIATNATPEGRALNRRVTLLVARTSGVQRGLTAITGQRHRTVQFDWGEEKSLEEELLLEGEPTVNAVRQDDGGVIFSD